MRNWILVGFFAVGFCVASQSGMSAAAQHGFTEHWRRPELDGVNSLYLHLQLCGYEDSYSEYRQKISDLGRRQMRDLATVERVAASLGYPQSIVRLTVDDLAELRHSAIVHLEDEKDGGAFATALLVDDYQAIIVYGGSAELASVTRDQFRKNWTGYALIPKPRSLMRVADLLTISVSAWIIATSMPGRSAPRGTTRT